MEDLKFKTIEEIKDLQSELLNSPERIVVCNWKRGSGKSYALAKYILQNRFKNVAYITPSKSMRRSIVDKIKEIIDYEGLQGIGSDKISVTISGGYLKSAKVEYCNYEKTKIWFDLNYNNEYDVVLYDDYKISNYNCFNNNTKTIVMMTDDSAKFINDGNAVTRREFINEYIGRLIKELNSLENNPNTIITREKLINMIEKMYKLKHFGL